MAFRSEWVHAVIRYARLLGRALSVIVSKGLVPSACRRDPSWGQLSGIKQGKESLFRWDIAAPESITEGFGRFREGI